MNERKEPYKLSELAGKRWPKTTEEDLILKIEKGSLRAWFRYQGFPVVFCKPEEISRNIYYKKPDLCHFPEFAYAFGEVIGVLRWKDKTELTHLYFVKYVEELKKLNLPKEDTKKILTERIMCPAKEIKIEGKTQWVKTTYSINRNDLVIPAEEVHRLDQELLDGTDKSMKLKDEPSADAQNNMSSIESTNKSGGRPKIPFTEAIEKAYRYFLETGNTEILKPGNVRQFLKSLIELANDESAKGGFKKNDISLYLAERVKGVKKIKGTPHIETHEIKRQKGKRGWKVFPSDSYPITEISKKLNKLRDKYPLPS